MADLKDQLRTYYESTTEPIDIDGFVDALLDQESEGAEVIVGPFGTRTRSPMPDQSPTPWYRSLIGLAAAILTAVAIGVIAFTVASGPDDEVADSTEITAPPTTASASEFTEAEALAVVQEYFAAFERGDIDAMAALFADGASLRWSVWGDLTPLSFATNYSWKYGGGTEFSEPTCVPRILERNLVGVTCQYAQTDSITRAVGADPVAHTLDFTIGLDGVASWIEEVSSPGFVPVDRAFSDWLLETDPEAYNEMTCCYSVSDPNEARARGELRRAHAITWSTYLDDNSCDYLAVCVDQVDGLAVAEEFVNIYLAGDGESIRSWLTADVHPGTRVYGNAAAADLFEDVTTHHAWNVAQGTTIGEAECRFRSQVADGAWITCDYATEQPLRELVGADPLSRSLQLTITESGLISEIVDAVLAPEPYALDGSFQSWIRANHPEVEALTGCCNWASVGDATLAGETRREYAELWASYLEENGCTWDQPCEP